MTVAKLIEYLQTFPKTADVMLWNGIVEDMMPIDKDIQTHLLYKQSLSFYKSNMDMDWCVRHKSHDIPEDVQAKHLEIAKEHYSKAKYEIPNPFVEQEKYADWYNPKSKKIILLQAKLTGKRYQDRMGSIDY